MTGIVEHLLAAPAWLALLVVFALPALESSAFLGFAFPGETAVILGGVYAGQGKLSVLAVAAAAIAGAVAGDAVGYLVGRRWGRSLLDSTFGRFVKADHLDRRARRAAARLLQGSAPPDVEGGRARRPAMTGVPPTSTVSSRRRAGCSFTR